MATELTRCDVCGARLPVGTPAGFCPFCVADDEVPDEPTTRVLGDCELLEEIGRGGMGVVWRARQRALNRDVAVKTLPGGDLAGAEARARFRNEAQATARLKHPNLVPVHEVGESDGVPYLVMELVEGRPLSEVLATKPASAKLSARWLRDVALAVQHAHDQGVLHRDLKPSNILIESGDDGGRPRVTDFGLAKLADADHSLTSTGSAVGSPSYMPPEQARRGEYTARSDVYGLGAVLYCALTGRPPFQGESVATILAQVEVDEPISPRRLQGNVPFDLETICLKCLEKNPSRRYATARELADDLTRFLAGELVLARPVGPLGKLTRIAWRHPWRATAVIMAVVALFVAGFALAWNARAERRHSAALQKEQAATQVALMRAQLGEARAIIRLRLADSRPRAEAIVRRVLDGNPSTEIRAQVRDVALAALALPSAFTEPLLGGGVVTDDWTMAVGDLSRDRWALASYRGEVALRPLNAATNLLTFDTARRDITALIAFSPGGRWLAIRHREELCVWDTSSGATQRLAFAARPWSQGRSFSFTKIAFAPDDRAVLWLDGESVTATSLPGGAELARWRNTDGTELSSDAIAFDPSGKFFAVARAGEAAVELRSWPEGKIQRVFTGRFPQSLCALALTEGARHIAGGDKAGRVTLWPGDGREGSLVELRGHTEMIRGLNFSADGRLLASTSEDGTMRAWDCAVGDELAMLNFDAATPSFAADGTRIGVGYGAGRLSQLRLERSPVLHGFRPEPLTEMPQVVSFFPDGRTLACLGANEVFRCTVPDGRVLAAFPFPRPHSIQTESANGGGLLISGADGVRRFELASLQPSSILPASRWGLDGLTISADGRWLAASDNAGQRVASWPAGAVDGASVKFLRADSTGTGMVALSPDGSKIALAYRYDPGLVILDVATGKALRRLDLPPRHSLAWSPDGHWLAASGTTAPLWNTSTWERASLPALESNHPPAGDAAFSSLENGVSKWLAVVTGGNRITLIDPVRREVAATLEAPSGRLIYKVRFSPDNRWLAAACARGEVQLWDLQVVNGRKDQGQVVRR